MDSQVVSQNKVNHYEFTGWKVSSRMFLDFGLSIRFQVGNPRVGVLFERGCQFYQNQHTIRGQFTGASCDCHIFVKKWEGFYNLIENHLSGKVFFSVV